MGQWTGPGEVHTRTVPVADDSVRPELDGRAQGCGTEWRDGSGRRTVGRDTEEVSTARERRGTSGYRRNGERGTGWGINLAGLEGVTGRRGFERGRNREFQVSDAQRRVDTVAARGVTECQRKNGGEGHILSRRVSNVQDTPVPDTEYTERKRSVSRPVYLSSFGRNNCVNLQLFSLSGYSLLERNKFSSVKRWRIVSQGHEIYVPLLFFV